MTKMMVINAWRCDNGNRGGGCLCMAMEIEAAAPCQCIKRSFAECFPFSPPLGRQRAALTAALDAGHGG